MSEETVPDCVEDVAEAAKLNDARATILEHQMAHVLEALNSDEYIDFAKSLSLGLEELHNDREATTVWIEKAANARTLEMPHGPDSEGYEEEIDALSINDSCISLLQAVTDMVKPQLNDLGLKDVEVLDMPINIILSYLLATGPLFNEFLLEVTHRAVTMRVDDGISQLEDLLAEESAEATDDA